MTGGRRCFRSWQDVERAVLLLEEASRDLRRSLDHAPGQYFWVGYQEQAQAAILEVSASMDVGYFGLPHPWDLRGWGDARTRADDAMKHAIECLTQTNQELQAMLRRAEIASGRRHARAWKALAIKYREHWLRGCEG